MHAAVLTLLIVVGADQSTQNGTLQPTPDSGYEATETRCGEYGDCCGDDFGGLCAMRQHLGCLRAWCGPMPQTCYAPRFGCYPGNNRCMHRYPAFHGYYYRRAYNYRQAFDYPWHATPHEPMGFFSYEQPVTEQEVPEPVPMGEGPSVQPDLSRRAGPATVRLRQVRMNTPPPPRKLY